MNLNFMNLVLEKTDFPEEARVFFRELADKIIAGGYEAEFDGFVDVYFESNCDSGKLDGILKEFAGKAGGSHFSYWMLMLILATERAKPMYDARGVSEEVFWDTFADLRSKAIECHDVQGIWGTFVAFWYGLFYTCKILKFGRLEYQECDCGNENIYTVGGIKILPGMKLLSIHIPSNFGSFSKEIRMDSYKKAYDFFSKAYGMDTLIFECGSWLLCPVYREVLGPESNVVSFMDDFKIISSRSSDDHFGDAWRVFGKAAHDGTPLADWPEDTTMRRKIKAHLLAGGKTGSGRGYFAFDGEKLIND